jgi:hypothetical protein
VVRRSRWHHGWANPRKREEPTLGPSRTDGARLAACHRSRKGDGVARKKRMEVEASLPARIARARVWLLARRSLLQKSVGDVWPRISSANALQKERQGRVNGGLAPCSCHWVKPGARARGEMTNRASAFTATQRERTGARLRVARDRHPAVASSLTRCGGRGAGAVMATGSYEEPLPAEGTPVITKRRLSRGGADGGLGGLEVLRPVPTLRRAGRTARLQRLRRQARREDDDSESRHGCQRFGRVSAVGRIRPRS